MANDNNNDNAAIVPVTSPKPAFKVKAVGLAARKQALANKQKEAGLEVLENAQDATHKIGIIFDDSASMSGTKIEDAHAGTEEFLRSCNPKNTAVAVYPMNPSDDRSDIKLSAKLYTAAVAIKGWQATGGTPLFETLIRLLDNEVLTRGIIFSDGEPNYGDMDLKDSAITQAVEKHIPIDTVFIGYKSDERAIATMKEIADKTGGVFMIFEPGRANFRTAFKYLSPGYRAMLMDKSFVEKVESGKVN